MPRTDTRTDTVAHRNQMPPPRLSEVSEVSEVSDGLYAYVQPDGSWWINNSGFLVGAHGVIAVDACATVARTNAFGEAIRSITSLPVRTLVNTHHHGDHTFGNFLFDTATIVAHRNAREALLAWGPPHSAPHWSPVDWGEIEITPPFLVFDDTLTIYVDDLACHLIHLGTPAHTTNDIVVWIPERKVLYSGDLLFNGGTPFVVQGSIDGARLSLERLRAFGAETIVPGHGALCGPEVIEAVDGYLAFVQQAARDTRAAGLTPLEAARELDLGPYADLLDPERIVGNLHRAYAELDGLPPGGVIDVAAALADMVAYNGGRPLTCLA